jgi:superfamily II DNA or RNA helicase
MKSFITVHDEVWCTISGLSPQHINFLYNKFGIHVDGYFFMPKFKLGHWDGKIRFFKETGKTYIRLIDKIIPFIETWGYEIELIDNRALQKIPEHSIEIQEVDETGIALKATGLDIFGQVFNNDGRLIELRPYQAQCVKLAVDNGSGFIIAGTGAGKTLITAGISAVYGSIGHKIITIVPSDDLVKQTYAWYFKCGLDVGMYSGSNKDINHTHVVATWQALQYNPEIMSFFSVIIWDESHGIKASVAQTLLNTHGKHIAFRFGVTGTFPKPESDQMSLISSVGEILKEIPAKWLIKHGFLAKVKIQPVEINETYVHEEFPDYDSEKSFLGKSPHRMEKIADLIISMCATHGNTLVLVNNIPFGKKLASLIKNSVFLYGESSSDLRKEHYEMFENRDDLIVIASSGIASTGISIDRIFCLMLIDPLKSFIKAIQSIGRGLRKAHDKDEVFVVDVYSKLKWARKHHRERLKYYKDAEYPVEKKLTLKVNEE